MVWVHAATPRYPNPKSPDEIWQNDKDLYDNISKIGGYVVQSSQTVVVFATATTASTYQKTNVKVTITPHSSANKIRVSATGTMNTSNEAADICLVTIKQDLSNLASPMDYLAQGVNDGTITGALSNSFSIPPVYSTVNISSAPIVYELYMRTSAAAATCTLCGSGCQLLVEEIHGY